MLGANTSWHCAWTVGVAAKYRPSSTNDPKGRLLQKNNEGFSLTWHQVPSQGSNNQVKTTHSFFPFAQNSNNPASSCTNLATAPCNSTFTSCRSKHPLQVVMHLSTSTQSTPEPQVSSCLAGWTSSPVLCRLPLKMCACVLLIGVRRKVVSLRGKPVPGRYHCTQRGACCGAASIHTTVLIEHNGADIDVPRGWRSC